MTEMIRKTIGKKNKYVYVVTYISHVSVDLVKVCRTLPGAMTIAKAKMDELDKNGWDKTYEDDELSWTHDRLGDITIDIEELGD